MYVTADAAEVIFIFSCSFPMKRCNYRRAVCGASVHTHDSVPTIQYCIFTYWRAISAVYIIICTSRCCAIINFMNERLVLQALFLHAYKRQQSELMNRF